MDTALQRYFMQNEEIELKAVRIDDRTVKSELLRRLRKLQSSKVVFGLTTNYKVRWEEEITIMLELKRLGGHTEDFLDIDEQINERRDLIRTIERE